MKTQLPFNKTTMEGSCHPKKKYLRPTAMKPPFQSSLGAFQGAFCPNQGDVNIGLKIFGYLKQKTLEETEEIWTVHGAQWFQIPHEENRIEKKHFKTMTPWEPLVRGPGRMQKFQLRPQRCFWVFWVGLQGVGFCGASLFTS